MKIPLAARTRRTPNAAQIAHNNRTNPAPSPRDSWTLSGIGKSTSPLRWNGGNNTNRQRHKRALTRDYKEIVVARIKRDRKFAPALHAEAAGALLEGDADEGLSMTWAASHTTDGRWLA